MRSKTVCLWLIVTLLLGSLLGVYSGETVLAASARQVTAVPPNNDLPTETPAPTFTSTSTETFTPTWTYLVTDTPTTTATGTPTDTSTPTQTYAATYTQGTSTPSAPAHLVISEFRSRGPNGSGDEFVELYNPTGDTVNIGGWSIRRSAGCGATTYSLVSIASNTILQAGQHFLAVSSTSTVTGADQPTFSAALADDGGLALVDLAGRVVDQAGMCITTQYREGANLAPLSGTANQSYERKPGGNTACYDTDNNASDFVLITQANPQNKASPISICSGIATSTPAYTPTFTLTYTQTRTPTNTSMPTQTNTVTNTPTITTTGTYTSTPTDTIMPTQTNTVTDTPTTTSTVTHTNTRTDTPTFTATPTVTDTLTPTNTDTPTGTSTPTSSATPSHTKSSTSTHTPDATHTPSLTKTFSPTRTFTLTKTDTPTRTPSNTRTPSPTKTLSPTPTSSHTSTSTDTFTPTLSPTETTTPTLTPTAPAHLVISEFRSRGPNGSSDEFVELYNPTGGAVNLGGWSIRRSASCGATTYNLVTISSTSLLAGQHFLAVSSNNSSITDADQTFSPALADDGGLALIDPSGLVVDQAGMCISTQYREGTNLAPLSGTADQSYERKPGGDTACYDTDNNASDFALISSSNPQNKANPVAMCAGVVTFTPTYTLTSTPTSTQTFTPTSTPTRTLTRTPTRTPTHTPAHTPTRVPTAFPGSVVINEFLPRPHTDWNEDGTVNVGDEYIEVINIGAATVNIKNWKLDNGGKGYYKLPDLDLLPRQIAVFFHSETGVSLRDGGGTVRLLKPDGYIADFYNYPKVKAIDQTWCRLPDGNGGWAFACRPGPGRPNIPFDSATPTPGSAPGMGVETDCSLVDMVPQSIVLAECGGFGSGIWNGLRENQFWLQERWKWNVFVE